MPDARRLGKLVNVLTWNADLDPLSALTDAVKGGNVAQLSPTAAVCFDSNVFLNLGKGSKGAELIDYFREKHEGPLILPAQVLLELWNNHLHGVEGYVEKLAHQFEELNKTIESIDQGYSGLRDGAKELAKGFREQFGYVFDERTRADMLALLDMLSGKAIRSQVPRAELSMVADLRKRTKTPPGFKDDGHGDFFVWAEFLYGLLTSRAKRVAFDRAILVTDDTKKDWSTNGTPHPMLVAEVNALVGVPFQVMTLNEIKTAVRSAVDS